jgi:alkanesulfonate monooxygenase SsuD/methylene tetrahydromethanopterin reductase-like flavin-dependent oxidoreductase (luciferase family)
MKIGVLSQFGGVSSETSATDWQLGIDKIKLAESLGVDCVMVSEAWGLSAIPWMSLIATQTKTIQSGSCILNAFSRSPAALAQEFASLEVLSNGRMLFGLGASGANVIEHFHGISYEKPLKRMREYVDIFKILISGEKLFYDGEIYKLERGFRLDYNRPRDYIPIYIASLTPKSVKQSGEIADGIFPIHWPKEQFASLRTELQEGANLVDQNKSLTIAPQTRLVILDGEDDESKWIQSKKLVHYYINRMGTFYWQALSRNGFEEEVQASRKAWKERNVDKSIAAITNEMIESIQIIGTIDEIKEKFDQRFELGADLQLIQMPLGGIETTKKILNKILG